MIWFTSDTHWWHKHIIDYCKRPWGSVEEMNEGLIERWNSRIKPKDHVYHLGDFAFSGKTKVFDILQRLNGIKHLVKGNHDPIKIYRAAVEENLLEWVRDYYVLRVAERYEDDDTHEIVQHSNTMVLCHFPILSWDNMAHGSWHLHGHCHGTLPPTGMMRMDVGVDPNNWYPINYEEVKSIMLMRGIVPVDHHGL